MQLKSPHVRSVDPEWHVSKTGEEYVLVVTTDLAIDANDPNFNKTAVDDLMAEITSHVVGGVFDRATLRRAAV